MVDKIVSLIFTKSDLGEQAVRIHDEVFPVDLPLNTYPVGFEYGGQVKAIHFSGVIGVIERVSRVHGRVDIEHFIGAECLEPYVLAFEGARARAEASKQALREANAKAAEESLALAKASEEALAQRAAAIAAEKASAGPGKPPAVGPESAVEPTLVVPPPPNPPGA